MKEISFSKLEDICKSEGFNIEFETGKYTSIYPFSVKIIIDHILVTILSSNKRKDLIKEVQIYAYKYMYNKEKERQNNE